tara:strand:+ start:8167 stop:9789 length:1623 start_codon:yes stop_codon:yes gene_type:complete
MSVVTKETIIYTERKNYTYQSEDEIQIYIPPSVALLNTKDCYLIANLKVTGKLKACVSERAGAYALFRSVTIMSGDGQQVIETLDNYAIMQALQYYYSQAESINNLRTLHEGKPNKVTLGDTSCNQYVDAQSSVNNGVGASGCHNNIEVLLPLYLSGCLKPSRIKVFPNIALNGLRIKIQLNNAETSLQVVKAPLYEYDSILGVKKTGTFGGYTIKTGGYRLAAQANAGTNELTLKNTSGDLQAGQNAILSADVEKPAHLFVIGQTLQIQTNDEDNPEEHVLSAVDIVTSVVDNKNTYNIKLTLATNLAQNAPDFGYCNIKLDTDSGSKDQGLNFEFSQIRMNVGFVQPPPKYLQSVIKQIEAGKMNFDILTYTDFPVNVSANSNNNSLYINSRNNRGKALLSIPQGGEANSVAEDSFKPDRETVRDYQYILYKVLTPDKRVNLNRFNLESHNAQALREMMLALDAADIRVNNIKDSYEHFFIGRRLALPGYSYNCNRPQDGEIRLNVNYKEVGKSLMMHNFMVHLRQVQVQAGQINIVY